MSNIFAFYKPKGITSNDAVQRVKRLIGVRGAKIGHAGTLDPLAQGVLVIAVGREATKTINDVVKKEKEYIAEITLGSESSTDDAEGEKTEIKFVKKPEIGDIKKILPEFIGKIKQTPPIYSAIKVSGKEAYKYARKGQPVEMQPREVEVKNIEILDYAWPILKIKVLTGPGTYIRSLARDIGKKLGTGGYLSFLERTRVGDFKKEDSIFIEDLPDFLKSIEL
ncbi:MAG: tRNA pseudouridine(55) synthase TruB [Patescibacteria group bacterium]|nr:tRNA pseudouridine(55) synthase TruB [Patescibacteria group bacterium]